MKMNIKGKEVEMRYSIRSLVLFENITNKAFEVKNITDVIVFMLCCILASDSTVQLTFDELVQMVDDDYTIIDEFSTWLTGEMSKQRMLGKDIEQPEIEDEKKTK